MQCTLDLEKIKMLTQGIRKLGLMSDGVSTYLDQVKSEINVKL